MGRTEYDGRLDHVLRSRVDRDLYERLQALAKREGRKDSAIVRRAVRELLEREEGAQ